MSSIPEEIIHDILLRSPVKSLLVCKSVCKNWFSLISSNDFVKMHHHRTIQRNNPTTLLLNGCEIRCCKNIFSIGYDSCELLLSKLLLCETNTFVTYAMDCEIDYPFRSLEYYVLLAGSCNGLVCLWFFREHFFCLWNPATREHKKLPALNVIYDVVMVAFGYDSNSNDYKIIAGGESLFEVFSLKSNSWRNIENVPYDDYISKRFGVLVNGKRHWLVRRNSDVILVCLDISNEIFKEMELPKELLDEIQQQKKEHRYCGLEFDNLGVVEGCLCLLVVDANDCTVQIWMMQVYGVGESWTKLYTVNDERIANAGSISIRLMWSFKSGEILFGGASTGLLLYIPRDDKVIKPNIYSLATVRQEERYFESLISLKSEQPDSTMAEPLILRGTLVGHSDMVTAIACPIYNSDMIVSSSHDKSILVWTLSKRQGNYGVPKHRLTGHNHFVQDVAISSDAMLALSGSWDGELRLWDLNTGVTTRIFVGHTKEVLSVAFSTDNSRIVSASRDCSIKVWNTLGGCMYTIQDGDSHTNWVSCVRFSPERSSPTFVSASSDKTVKVWNSTNCTLRNTLIGHGGYVNTVAVSPNGSLCASGGKDGVMLLWDLAEGKKSDSSFNAGGIIHALCISPNKYWFCAATEESVKIWDLESQSVLQELKVEPEPGKSTSTFYCSSVNWSSDGSTLFTGYTDGVIRVWGLKNNFLSTWW